MSPVPPMRECVLVAELGLNPAPLAELLWALPRQRGLHVRAAYVLVPPLGEDFLRREFLAPGAAHEQLRNLLGDAVPSSEALFIRCAVDREGYALDDELTASDAAAWNEARWRNALDALRAAGDDPVVFALAGGRRRTSTAVDTVVAQLLARAQDIVLDVRVGDLRVEGARVPFSFPEQTEQRLSLPGGDVVVAREVAVVLVDVQVPRLRRLLGDRALDTYQHALDAGQDAVEAAVVVTVTVNLAKGTVLVNDVPVSLSESEFVWFATFAAERAAGGEGWVASDDFDLPREMLHRIGAARNMDWRPGAEVWRDVLAGKKFAKDDRTNLRTLRSKAASHFRERMEKTALPRPVIERAAFEYEFFGEEGSPGRLSKWRLGGRGVNVVVVDGR